MMKGLMKHGKFCEGNVIEQVEYLRKKMMMRGLGTEEGGV